MITILLIIFFQQWNCFLPAQITDASNNQSRQNMEQMQRSQQLLEFAKSIQWLGQATVRITYNGQTVYIDPYQINAADKADLILITHDHGDHLSPSDISKIAGKNTKFIVAQACEETLKKEGYLNIQSVKPGTMIMFKDLSVNAVPAYNIKKPMHKKSSDYLGFVIDFGGIRLYHTGDTERIPEMKDIRCDIIILPLGQTYTMNSVEEAVEAVLDTKATIAIPIHYGLYEGTKEDALQFSDLLIKKGVTVLWGR